jgi:hypothetical protein
VPQAIKMERERVRREIELLGHLAGRHPLPTGLYQLPEHVEAIILSESSQSHHGVFFFHNSTNMEILPQCQGLISTTIEINSEGPAAQFEHRTGATRCVRRNRRRQKRPAGKPPDATRDFPSRPSLTELACAAEPESPTVERAPGLRLNSAPAHVPLNGFHFGLMTGPAGGLLSTHFTAHMTVTFKSLLHILPDDFLYRTTHRNSKTELQKSRHIK